MEQQQKAVDDFLRKTFMKNITEEISNPH